MYKIYHNQNCSKSCAALDLLIREGVETEVHEYLIQAPTKQELTEILVLLGLKPLELIRKNEALFHEKFSGLELSDSEWINVMVENPILIEWPIIVKENKAVLARPIENLLELLNS